MPYLWLSWLIPLYCKQDGLLYHKQEHQCTRRSIRTRNTYIDTKIYDYIYGDKFIYWRSGRRKRDTYCKDRLTTEDVVAYSESKRTGTDGKVTFTNILGGDYTYLVEKQNWIPVNGDVVVDSNKDIQVSFNPMPTFNMTFTVNDYNTFTGEKKPLNGATVKFAGLTKQTSDNGQAVFEGVLGGKYSYDVFYDNNHQRVYVENYEFYNNSSLTIDLKQLTYKTTIKVYGAGGTVVEGAKVKVNDKDFVQEDSSGVVLELPNGVYTAIASYEEYEDREQQFTVNGNDQVVSIYMDQTLYDLTFVVTEDNGIISNGTRITLNQGGAGEQTGLTNNGQIKFSVPRMRYDWVLRSNISVIRQGLCNQMTSQRR